MRTDVPGDVFIAMGGAAILAWYGWKRYRTAVAEEQAAESAQAAVRKAFDSEFAPSTPEATVTTWEGAGGAVVCEACDLTYPAGTAYCLSCGAPTQEPAEPMPPLATTRPGEDPSAPVCVQVVDSHWKASLLKGFLESHNIACITQGNVPSGVYHFTVTPLSEVRLLVRREDVAAARVLLAEWD